MLKIAILSLYINDWYREITKYGKQTIQNYANKYNYDFIYESENTIDGVYDGGLRELPWYKILLLKKVLLTNKYDYVVWIDADSQLIDDSNNLEYYINTYMKDKNILISTENGNVVNTSVVFMKNTTYCKKILDVIWNNDPNNFDKNFHEQSSLANLYTNNINKLQENMIIIPSSQQNVMLTYWYSYYPGKCFLFFAARCAHNKVGFLWTMDRYCPIKMDEESEEDYKIRKEWLNNIEICRNDIDHYLNNGMRRNLTQRYIKINSGKYFLPEKIEKKDNLKIGVCSLSYGKEYKNTVKYGRINKIQYCKKYNYKFIEDESVIDKNRDLQWSKIPLLKKYLNQYDYLIWIDSDTYITNDSININNMIEKLGNNSMMYEKDPFIWINTGFMLLKNNNFCKEILEECYKHTNEICHEQGSIDMLYRTNWNNSQNKIKILEHSDGYNQYWHSWKMNDFLIHFPGCHEPALKKEALNIMMNRFCPFKMNEETNQEYIDRKELIQEKYIENEYIKNNKIVLPLNLYK
jgi:hypothetical protein